MRLVLLGPPGAGKGTQALRLAEWLEVPAISTGDIFRANVAGNTALGKRARSYTDTGKLVPDELTNEMVENRLAQPDVEAGFLLDGYPRNVAQAGALDRMLQAAGVILDAVVEIIVSTDDVIARLRDRARIEGRADDSDDVIRRRLEVYAEQTVPLTLFYSGRNQLVQVDGTGGIDEVTGRLTRALAAYRD